MLMQRITAQLTAAGHENLARLVLQQSETAAKKAALVKQALIDERIAIKENLGLE